MSEKKQNQNDEMIGMGVRSSTPIKASPEQVWEAMVDKMYNTDKYLPVTNLKISDIRPGQHIYREMVAGGKQLNENIYFDKSRYEIRCAMVDEDSIHINIYYPDTGLLEYWQENGKGERIPWQALKSSALKAMEKVKEVAEANKEITHTYLY